MFETVLVADRGVAALRVLRAAQRLGAAAVAVHGDDDARAPHVVQADDAVPLGGRSADATYADGRKLLEAARLRGASAVHPGAGPLSLDPGFARAVTEAGLTWLGPPPELLARSPARPPEERGRRLAVVVARREGREQVLGRRSRWAGMLDEEPAPDLPEPAAAAVAGAATPGPDGLTAVDVRLGAEGASAVGLLPLLEPGVSATEAVSGLDLAELQLRLAAGERGQDAGPPAGAAVALHVRVVERYAGRLRRFRAAQADGVRSECAVAEGSRLTAGSGRLLAVVTAAGRDRAQAVERALAAVEAFEVSGVPTTLPLLRAVLADPSFVAGEPDDALLERIRRG